MCTLLFVSRTFHIYYWSRTREARNMVYIYLPYGGVYLLQGTGTNEPTSNDKTSNFKAISGSSYTCFGISCDFYVKLKHDVAFALVGVSKLRRVVLLINYIQIQLFLINFLDNKPWPPVVSWISCSKLLLSPRRFLSWEKNSTELGLGASSSWRVQPRVNHLLDRNAGSQVYSGNESLAFRVFVDTSDR